MGKPMKLLSISAAALAMGMSCAAIRRAVDRGALKAILVDGQTMIQVRGDQPLASNPFVPYMEHTMQVVQTGVFKSWFENLKDRRAKNHILVRIGRLERGNFGDVKPVGEGVSEMRIHDGPGYRLYLKQQGKDWVLLLCGGDKGSQARDILRAKQLAKDLNG
jgi:putative addiction module killer protein